MSRCGCSSWSRRRRRTGLRAVSPAGVQIAAPVVSAPDNHLAASPNSHVVIPGNRRVSETSTCPVVRGWIVSPARVQMAAVKSAPYDHLAACPHGGVRASCGEPVARGRPSVRIRIVSSAAVGIIERLIDATPDNHFTAGPDCRVSNSAKRHIDKTSRHPTVVSGTISAASVQVGMVRDRVSSTPDDHFAARPHCRVVPSCGRRARSRGSRPAVGARVVSPTSIKVAITTTSNSAPDNQLAARPDRRVIGSCGRCISGAGRCPTVGYRIVSAASVQKLAGRGEPAPDNQLATCPHRALTASCLRCVGGAGRCPSV